MENFCRLPLKKFSWREGHKSQLLLNIFLRKICGSGDNRKEPECETIVPLLLVLYRHTLIPVSWGRRVTSGCLSLFLLEVVTCLMLPTNFASSVQCLLTISSGLFLILSTCTVHVKESVIALSGKTPRVYIFLSTQFCFYSFIFIQFVTIICCSKKKQIFFFNYILMLSLMYVHGRKKGRKLFQKATEYIDHISLILYWINNRVNITR